MCEVQRCFLTFWSTFNSGEMWTNFLSCPCFVSSNCGVLPYTFPLKLNGNLLKGCHNTFAHIISYQKYQILLKNSNVEEQERGRTKPILSSVFQRASKINRAFAQCFHRNMYMTLKQATQRCGADPVPGDFQGQAGGGSETPDITIDVPVLCRDVGTDGSSSNSKDSMVLSKGPCPDLIRFSLSKSKNNL